MTAVQVANPAVVLAPRTTRRLDIAAALSIPALIALILLLWSLNRDMDAAQFFIGNTANDVLYAATFEQYADDFNQYGGRLSAQVDNGMLIVQVDEANNGAFSTASPGFSDFDLRVNATALAGPLDNAFGVIFGLNAGNAAQAGDDRYYLFEISSDGYYRLSRAESGELREISNWIESPVVQIGLNEENNIRIVSFENQLRFWVNGQPASLCIPNNPAARSLYRLGTCIDGQMLDVWQASASPVGQIALTASATATGGPGVQVGFNDLIILGVDASTLAE